MKCPHCGEEINPASMMGSVKSEAKAKAARLNGAKRRPEMKRYDSKQIQELRAKLASIPRGGLVNEVIRGRILDQLQSLGVSE